MRSFDDALVNAATSRYLDERRETHRALEAAGVFLEDCLGHELPAAITNRYLAIKCAGLLYSVLACRRRDRGRHT